MNLPILVLVLEAEKQNETLQNYLIKFSKQNPVDFFFISSLNVIVEQSWEIRLFHIKWNSIFNNPRKVSNMRLRDQTTAYWHHP